MRAFGALLSALWRYSRGRRRILILYISMFVMANIILLLEPYVIGQVLNAVQQAGTIDHPLQTIIRSLLLILGLNLAFWVFHGPARVMEISQGYYANNAFVNRLYRIITSLPAQWHKDNHSGQSINRLRKASRALNDFTSNSYQFIEMIIRLVGSVTALFLLMPLAAFIAIIVSVVALCIVFFYDRFQLRRYDAINNYEHFTAAALHDYITNIITVITLRLEELTRSEVWRRLTQYRALIWKTTAIEESKWFLATMIISLMTVIVLSGYAYTMLRSGVVPLAGTFFMLYEYLQKIGAAFYTFAWKYSNTVQQYADLKSADIILQAERVQSDDSVCLPKTWQNIAIDDLQFTYQDEEHRTHHLKDLSLTLGHGKKIALVGESGSGKSTLMALIRGLQRTQEVTVLCDDRTLPHGLKHLAPHVTLIPQEPEIFANTIEYNISVDTEVAEEELLKDIELAQFSSVLKRLPRGIKTDIAEKGVNLSGGEKQRLALARGIFAAKTSDIILLDEPTSSVDSQNERRIYENLFSHFADRCIISSIHRLHLLPMFDEIYVLKDGELVEQGSFDSLIKKDGMLAEMWRAYQQNQEQ